MDVNEEEPQGGGGGTSAALLLHASSKSSYPSSLSFLAPRFWVLSFFLFWILVYFLFSTLPSFMFPQPALNLSLSFFPPKCLLSFLSAFSFLLSLHFLESLCHYFFSFSSFLASIFPCFHSLSSFYFLCSSHIALLPSLRYLVRSLFLSFPPSFKVSFCPSYHYFLLLFVSFLSFFTPVLQFFFLLFFSYFLTFYFICSFFFPLLSFVFCSLLHPTL